MTYLEVNHLFDWLVRDDQNIGRFSINLGGSCQVVWRYPFFWASIHVEMRCS